MQARLRWVLGLGAALAACESSDVCKVGCDEDQADCLDDPESYDADSRCAGPPETDLGRCHEQLCDEVYATCADQCDMPSAQATARPASAR